MQNKIEGMIYTNEKVFNEFGKLLTAEDQEKVKKSLIKAKESANSDDRQRLVDSIYDLQVAARILTGVMLYNPMKMQGLE